MFIRKTLVSIAFLGAFTAPAFAIDGAAFVGELGEATYGGPLLGQARQHSAKTRADALREVQLARQNGSLSYVDGALTAVRDYPGASAPSAAYAVPRQDRAGTTAMGSTRASDVSADGYRYVGGELGYLYVGLRRAN